MLIVEVVLSLSQEILKEIVLQKQAPGIRTIDVHNLRRYDSE